MRSAIPQRSANVARSFRAYCGGVRGAGLPADLDLLRRSVRPDGQEAFAELYRRYQAPAFGLCQRITGNRAFAEEALQEGMLAVWRSARSFEEDREVRCWLLRVIANCALKAASNAKRRAKRQLPLEGHETLERASGGSLAEHSEMGAALGKKVGQLPAPQRQVLHLYFNAALTQQEIGGLLKVPQRTVSYRLRQALGALRRGLAASGFKA